MKPLTLGASLLAFCVTMALPGPSWAQDCPKGQTCISNEDMKAISQLLKDQKCRADTLPNLKLDPVTIIVDKDGRIYGSGAEPHPYALKMDWCNYSIEAKGKATLTVAIKEEPTWGFRFRTKLSSGFLFVEAFHQSSPINAIDVGILWEGFYYKSLNLNVATGFRSAGIGVGLDLTRNLGLFVGYSVAYDGFRSNPYSAVSLAFW